MTFKYKCKFVNLKEQLYMSFELNSMFLNTISRLFRWYICMLSQETLFRLTGILNTTSVVGSHKHYYSGCCSLLCICSVSYLPRKINWRFWFLNAVSQVEFGVLHLVDNQNPQITVLVDCEGLTSLGFPMQMMRSCSTLLQDNFPNRLGCLLVIRLPPVARVIAQTVIQVRTFSI